MNETLPPFRPPPDKLGIVVGSDSPRKKSMKDRLRLAAEAVVFSWRWRIAAGGVIVLSVAAVFLAAAALRPSPELANVGGQGAGGARESSEGEKGANSAKESSKKDRAKKNSDVGDAQKPPSSGGSSGGSQGGQGGSGSPFSSDWPTPSTTGVPSGVTLTSGGPCVINTPDSTYSGKIFDCGSTNGLDVRAANVTIRNSFVETGQYWGVLVRPGASLVIEDTTVGGDSGCSRDSAISGGDFVARRVKVTSGGDAFDAGFHPSGHNRGNILIEHSYAKLCAVPPAHSDGLQSVDGGPNVVLNHNTIDMSFSDPGAQTAPVFWSDNSPYPVTVTNNLLIAGSFTIRIHDGSGHIVNNNVVARNKWLYGPVLIDVPYAQCNGNRVADVSSAYQVNNFAPLGCD